MRVIVASSTPNAVNPANAVPAYEMGSRVVLTAQFQNDAGVATNTTVTLMLVSPQGTISSPTPTNPTTGNYRYELDIPREYQSEGNWTARWEGSGAIVAASEHRFTVPASSFYPSPDVVPALAVASSGWYDTGSIVRLNASDRYVGIGVAAPIDGAKLSIDGDDAAPQLRIQADDKDSWIKYARVSPTLPDWDEVCQSFTFYDEPHAIHTIGFNWGPDTDLTKHAWGAQWEYSYKVSEFGAVVTEWFIRYRSTAATGSTELRPISCNVSTETNLISWGLRGEGSWEDEVGNQRVKFNREGVIDLNAGAMIRNTVNNQAILLGKLQGAGSMFEMVRISTSNWISWDLNPSFTGSYFASLRGVYVGRGTPLTSGKALFQVDSVAADKGSLPAPRNFDNALEAAFAATLGTGDEAIMIYNTQIKKYKFWNGTAFETITSA